jgi:ABC-2 type transport system permease protein
MVKVETRSPPVVAVSATAPSSASAAQRVWWDLRTMGLLWWREMIRLRHNPLRVVMGLVTPLLFVVVLGTGLDAASGVGKVELHSYRAYLFPGALIMAVQAPAIAVGISIVWDRRMGLLRQMLIAPLRRASIVFGLALGGATTAGVYGIMVLAVAGVASISYTPALLMVLLEVLLIGLMFTAIGLVAAMTIRSVDTFQVVVSLSLLPLLFFSGAMFPPDGLPGWLSIIVKSNPLTYAVDAIRRTLPGDTMLGTTQTKLTLYGWSPPVLLELCVPLLLAFVALAVASFRFSRAE